MALIESLGYKQEKYAIHKPMHLHQYSHSNHHHSTPQRRKSGSEWMTNDFSMTPYGTNNHNKQQGFSFNNTMNKENIGSSHSHRSQSLLGPNDSFAGGHSNIFSNESKQNAVTKQDNKVKSKYSSLPRKSMLSSGIGFVSPIPQKYAQGAMTQNANKNKLDLSKNETISPIKPHQLIVADNTLHLNSTQNTLNFSGMNHQNYPQNESRMSVNQNAQNIMHPNQITIIGFASGIGTFCPLFCDMHADKTMQFKARHHLSIANSEVTEV